MDRGNRVRTLNARRIPSAARRRPTGIRNNRSSLCERSNHQLATAIHGLIERVGQVAVVGWVPFALSGPGNSEGFVPEQVIVMQIDHCADAAYLRSRDTGGNYAVVTAKGPACGVGNKQQAIHAKLCLKWGQVTPEKTIVKRSLLIGLEVHYLVHFLGFVTLGQQLGDDFVGNGSRIVQFPGSNLVAELAVDAFVDRQVQQTLIAYQGQFRRWQSRHRHTDALVLVAPELLVKLNGLLDGGCATYQTETNEQQGKGIQSDA